MGLSPSITAYPFRGSAVTELFDDFTGDVSGSSTGSCGDTNFTPIKGAGTGALISTLAASAISTNPGIITMNTGTTATNASCTLRRGLAGFILGGGAITWEAMIRLPVLSTATEEYDVRIGLASTNGNADYTNAVYFGYTRSTTFTITGTITNNSPNVSGLAVSAGVIDLTSIQPTQVVAQANIPVGTTVLSVNAGAGTMVMSANATSNGSVSIVFTTGNFWTLKTAKASTRSTQVTSTAVTANTFVKLTATINAAGTSTAYKIGGVSVGTVSTNHPIVAVFPCFAINKTASAGANSTMDADYWAHQQFLTAPRV